VNLQSVGNFTDLRADGSRSILGNGTITLSNNGRTGFTAWPQATA
jgi:hypothetical protein